MARALAVSWFGSEKALLKFDMSEYQEQHTTARLLGAPPGYLGHDEGGQLTEAVRRRPYSVVLFDEIEKAHPDIQNILLQILEDGQLTDAMGRKADFRNTIVLLTSNLGARFLAGQSAPLGFAAGSEAVFEKQSAQAIEEAKKWFRPELVGRLDELIVFRPLAEDSLCAIAERGALHRERCIPVRLRQHQYPNRPPHTEEGAQHGCTLLRKGCHRRAQIKACLIAAPRQSIQKQVSCGDFCRRRAGIGRIKDTACFCHIAFPCKLYQSCISKFFIEFFLRAATQPQSGNVHGNAQVLHRPPKKRTEYAVPQWNCFIPAGYWAG